MLGQQLNNGTSADMRIVPALSEELAELADDARHLLIDFNIPEMRHVYKRLTELVSVAQAMEKEREKWQKH